MAPLARSKSPKHNSVLRRIEMELLVLKFIEDLAFVEAVAKVDHTVVATGKLGFARRSLQPDFAETRTY